MAKVIKDRFRLRVAAGAATPSPPVGPALGQRGLNIMEFCKAFNARTENLEKSLPVFENANGTPIESSAKNLLVSVSVTAYTDRSFDFTTTVTAADLLKRAANIQSGSGKPRQEKVGKITYAQLRAIAKFKTADLSGGDLEAMVRSIAGTARSMGLEVIEDICHG